jgi:hypothetical protein
MDPWVNTNQQYEISIEIKRARVGVVFTLTAAKEEELPAAEAAAAEEQSVRVAGTRRARWRHEEGAGAARASIRQRE